MTLRERFPEIAAKYVPDPSLDEIDEEPASAYLRTAFLESVQKFAPQVAEP